MKAHYSSTLVKQANAAAHGAVGVISLDSPTLERVYPFSQQSRDLAIPQFRWLDKEGTPNNYLPQLKGTAILSMTATAKLFAGGPHTPDEVLCRSKNGQPMSFALPVTAKIHNVTKLDDVKSPTSSPSSKAAILR